MADHSTSPGQATSAIATTRGLLTYAQLAPLLAERVQQVEQRIAAGDFAALRASHPLDWRPFAAIWRQRREAFET
jgi:hypothetical protein